MNEILLQLLRDKDFEALLKRLDDPDQRRQLLDSLEEEEASYEQEADSVDLMADAVTDRIWNDVNAGIRVDSRDSSEVSLIREWAIASGASRSHDAELARRRIGQLVLGAAAGCAAMFLVVKAAPQVFSTSRAEFPAGQFVAVADSRLGPEISLSELAGLEQIIDNYSNLNSKGGSNLTPNEELLKLILVYGPSDAELEELRKRLRNRAGADAR